MDIPKISRSKISQVAQLANRKFRRRDGLFVAEGSKCVRDTLDKFTLEYIAALPSWWENHPEIAEGLDGKVFETSESDMKKMTAFSTPSEVLAVYKIPEAKSLDQLLETPLEPDLYLMLDSIQDPGNLGTIIRTAHWFGIKHIFASPMTADLYNPKTVQSTMGSISEVDFDYIDLTMLSDKNPSLPVIGLQLEGQDIFTTPLPKTGFIVMGNEGNGLSPSMQDRIRLGLTIPPYNPASHPESLNVAVATAITISCFRKP